MWFGKQPQALLEHQHQRMPSYFILPSQKATLLLIPYHFTIPPTSQNSIFIKILFFNLSLLFLSNRYFFQTRRDSIFLGFSIVFFFLSLPQPLAQTTNTNKHKPSNPCRISLSPSTTTLSLNRICFPQPHTQTQTIKPTPIRNPRHQTIKPTKPSIRNPRRRFETQAVKNTQKSSPEPPSELPMINPTDLPTDQ